MLFWGRPMHLRLDQETPRQEIIVPGRRGSGGCGRRASGPSFTPWTSSHPAWGPLLDALGGLSRLDSAFNLLEPGPDEAPADHQGPVLALEPKTPRADLKRLVLWFSPDDLVLAGFKTISLIGDETEYRLTTVEVNPKLPDNTFAYSPPQGFRVLIHKGSN